MSNKICVERRIAKRKESNGLPLYKSNRMHIPLCTPTRSTKAKEAGNLSGEKTKISKKRAKKQRSVQRKNAPFSAMDREKEIPSSSSLPGTSAAPRSVETRYTAKNK